MYQERLLGQNEACSMHKSLDVHYCSPVFVDIGVEALVHGVEIRLTQEVVVELS
jgi:hypothetical protein